MSTAVAALPETIEEWTQEQRDSLLAIARRTLAGYGRYHFSREFIARHVDDFVQDALLQAWVSQQDPEAEALRIYNPAGFVSFKVIQLALDKAKGERRRLERAAPEGPAEDGGAFEAAVERVSDPLRTEEVHELAEHLQATKLAMAQLPERQRLAFVKCQLEGRSQAEVAAELSDTSEQPVSRKAVERLVANARVGLSIAFSRVASGAFCEEQRRLLELVDQGCATAEQEREAHAHLEDCSQCAQVRAFTRFERDAGLAAITLPSTAISTETVSGNGLLDGVQHMGAAIGERMREIAGRVLPLGGGIEPGGVAMGTATTTKAIVALCVAAGSTGGCVKALTEKPSSPKPAPSAHRARPMSRPAPAPASAPAPAPSSAPAPSPAPAPVADEPPPNRHQHKLSAMPAPQTNARSSAKPVHESTHQEFGFEGGSSSAGYSSTSSTVSSSPPSHATVSSVGEATGTEAVSTYGAESSGSSSVESSPSSGGSTTSAPSSSGGSGGSQSQEFGLGG